MRRGLAIASFHVFLVFLAAAADPPRELLRRARFLVGSAPRELALRRLAGSGTAFDRRYFAFLESLRRRLPPGTPGVALYLTFPGAAARHLAHYDLAPVPLRIAPPAVPAGWVAASYGAPPPPGWREAVALPGGAILARTP